MANIILQGHIIVPADDLVIVQSELVIHSQLTTLEPGCLTFNVTQDCDDKHKFHVYEEFIDDAAFQRHQTRVNDSNWGKVSVNVQRYYQISHVG